MNPTTQAINAINSRTTPRMNASNVDSAIAKITAASKTVMRIALTCRRHDAALPLGFELVANAGRSVARRIGTDSYAPQCSAARLERLRVRRIARALQAARERVGALIVGIGCQLHGEAVAYRLQWRRGVVRVGKCDGLRFGFDFGR